MLFCHHSMRVIVIFGSQSESDKDIPIDIPELLYIFHISK